MEHLDKYRETQALTFSCIMSYKVEWQQLVTNLREMENPQLSEADFENPSKKRRIYKVENEVPKIITDSMINEAMARESDHFGEYRAQRMVKESSKKRMSRAISDPIKPKWLDAALSNLPHSRLKHSKSVTKFKKRNSNSNPDEKAMSRHEFSPIFTLFTIFNCYV